MKNTRGIILFWMYFICLLKFVHADYYDCAHNDMSSCNGVYISSPLDGAGCDMKSFFLPGQTDLLYSSLYSVGDILYAFTTFRITQNSFYPTSITAYSTLSPTGDVSMNQLWVTDLDFDKTQTISGFAVDPSGTYIYILYTGPLSIITLSQSNGTILWTKEIDDHTQGYLTAINSTAFIFYGEKQYNEDCGGYMNILSPIDGRVLWRSLSICGTQHYTPKLVNETYLVMTIDDGVSLFNFDMLTWQWNTSLYPTIPPIVIGDVIVFGGMTAPPQIFGISFSTGNSLYRIPQGVVSLTRGPDNTVYSYVGPSNELIIVDALTGKIIRTINNFQDLPANSGLLYAVDQNGNIYIKGFRDYFIYNSNHEVKWKYSHYENGYEVNTGLIFSDSGVPFSPVLGGITYWPPCPPQPDQTPKILKIVSYVMSGIKALLIFLCWVAAKKESEQWEYRFQKSRFGLDIVVIIVTAMAGAWAIILTLQSMSVLVSKLENPYTYFETYLKPEPLQASNATFSLHDYCLCDSQYGHPDNPSNGCGRPGCGNPLNCPNPATWPIYCNTSFYGFSCYCDNYSPSNISCETHVSFGTKVQPFIEDAFDECHYHYFTITALLWTAFAINIFLVTLEQIVERTLEHAKKESKLPKAISYTCTGLTGLFIVISAILAKHDICKYVPASGFSDSKAYDTAEEILPGCIAKQSFDAEYDLLYMIHSAILVLSNKPIQMFLHLVGLYIIPSSFADQYYYHHM